MTQYVWYVHMVSQCGILTGYISVIVPQRLSSNPEDYTGKSNPYQTTT